MWDKSAVHQNTQHSHRGTDTARIATARLLSGNLAPEGWLASPNYVEGSDGWMIKGDGSVEFSDGYFRGDISAATGTFAGSISVGTNPNWFRVDTTGNMWLGRATLAEAKTATFAVTKEGALYAKSATIGNWNVNATSIYTGTEDHSGYTANAGDITIYSDGSDSSIHAKNFYIDTAGTLYCTAAVVSGAVTTTAGSSVDGQYLAAASVTGTAIASATITATNIQNATITTTQISGTAGITGGQIASATITGSNIASATIAGGNLVDGTITATQIANATITSTQIANATITTTQISGTAGITGGQIASATITATNIANGTITTTQIAAATIAGSNVAAGTITGSNIAAGTITAANITALTITAAEIANLTISAGKIGSGEITTTQISATAGIVGTQLANQTISATQIANGAITATQIANATITTTQISGTAAITGSQIATGTITATNIANGTITATQIANATITTTQISGTAAITGSQIATGTITATNIANGTITATQITNATITTTQIASATITASNIAALTITASEIANTTITSGKMSVTSLSSMTANMGTITAGNITLDTSGYIRAGQTAYNTGVGYWVGYDTSAYKLSIGDSTADSFTFDGVTIGLSLSGMCQFLAGRILAIGNPSGLNNSSAGGTVTISYMTTRFNSNGNNRGSLDSADDAVDASKDFSFQIIAKFTPGDVGDVPVSFIGIGDGGVTIPSGLNGAYTVDHAGIILGYVAGPTMTYWFSSGDGTTQEKTTITGLTMTNYNVFKIVKTSTSIKFYANGVLKATHSTNIPDDTSSNIFFSCSSGGASGNIMDIYNNYVFTQSLT